MDDTFKIFVQRIQIGRAEKIEETLPPSFLEIDEEEIRFEDLIHLKGEAEVTDDMLILRLSIKTRLTMPCSICNEDVLVNIAIPHFYVTEPLSAIKGGIYSYREALREAILLEIPYVAECHEGDCPERTSVAKYLAKNDYLGD